MPANFTEEERNAIAEALLREGTRLLETHGMKKLRIADLAKAVDIGTGTFYNFFSGKEDFIVALIKQKKKESLEAFDRLVEQHPNGIPFHEIKQYFLRNVKENNIYRFLTQEEINRLLSILPREDSTPQIGEHIMGKLATTKSVDAFSLFAEAYKIIVIGTSDLSKLNAALLDDALDPLVDAACRLLYE